MKILAAILAVTLAGSAVAQTTATDSPGRAPQVSFDSLDADHNGRLSAAEAASAVASFSTADKDGSGSLDRNEYMQYMKDTSSPGRAPAPGSTTGGASSSSNKY